MDQTGERPLKFVREAAKRWVRSHDPNIWEYNLLEHLETCIWGWGTSGSREWGEVRQIWLENKVEFEEVVRACQTIQKLKG